MGPEAKIAWTLSSALHLLGKHEDAEAVLRDIRPNEISFVDRAANRRRFLALKSGATAMGETNKTTAAGELSLPAQFKAEALHKLAEPLQRLVKATERVKTAKESDGGEAALPADLTTEVHAAATDLQKAFGGEPDALAKAVESLPAETRKSVAEQGVAKMGELVDGMSETADKMRVLGAIMMALGDAPDPDTVQAIGDKVAELFGGGEGGGTEPNPGDAADPNKSTPSGAQLAQGDQGAALSKLTASIDKLASKVDEIDKRTQPSAGAGNGGGEGQPTTKNAQPSLQDVMKSIDALSTKVSKLEETPATPASRNEPSAGSGRNGSRRTTVGSRTVL